MAIPYILSGRIDEEGAHQRREANHFDLLKIRYLNNKALAVHAGPDGGTVDLDDGSRLEYDRLLVATGSSPSLPPVAGTESGPATTAPFQRNDTAPAEVAPLPLATRKRTV